jgi:hypothetical protein
MQRNGHLLLFSLRSGEKGQGMQKAHVERGLSDAPNHQSDVGRIISDGFATIKNFSDWILISPDHARQGKIRDKILASNPFKSGYLRVPEFSTFFVKMWENPLF